MTLVAMRDIYFSFGGPMLLEGINFLIEPGERISVVGRNGCGKSTLLKIVQGMLTPASGEMALQPNLRIAMLDQSVPQDVTGKVFDVVASGVGAAGHLLVEYHNIESDKSNDSTGQKEKRLAEIHHQLDETHSWNKLNLIETAISMTGIDSQLPFESLSAGLKRRVLTAKALAGEPDLLILDEPTNHLDITSIGWLEDFLLRSGKALLFVTHDRRFLKKITTRIIEIDRGKLYNWDCDYNDYLKRKTQMLNAEQSQWNEFDKKLATEEEWIRRGVKARRRRNEGRVRSLMKMRETRSQRRKLGPGVKMQINAAIRSGEIVAKAMNVSFAYDKTSEPIINGLTNTIIRGDRVGIIGPNGKGKTTLLKLLLGQLSPDDGKIKHGANVKYAYFDQLHGQLKPNKTLIDNIGEGYGTVEVNGRKKHVFAYLADFLFDAEQSQKLVSTLSGGERNRLQIAKVFTQPSNVLVLDEPTNDLDIETLELLEDMLIEYPGTVLLVSHDRAFLNNVVTSTLVIEDKGTVKEYVGGYDDWLRQRSDTDNNAEERKTAKKEKPKFDNQKPPKLTFNQAKQLKALPEIIEKLEAKIASLHNDMADVSFYKQPANIITEANARLETINAELTDAYQQWEQLTEIQDAYENS
ncbi:MAG: ATP-binding cassette domain-containing protein [Anaerohalosphaeraceae bacterium]|nr:ATP-binding cassette domain-containing protein [Anaerohalosphaeraceae bacterium]